jgi:hypothetical protein
LAFLAGDRETPDDAAVDLWKAVEAYYQVYTSDPGRNVLHGARAAALVSKATRSAIPVPTLISSSEIANLVRDAIGDKEEMGRPLDLEECEAALISTLVLERYDEAVTRLQAYLNYAQVNVLNPGHSPLNLRTFCSSKTTSRRAHSSCRSSRPALTRQHNPGWNWQRGVPWSQTPKSQKLGSRQSSLQGSGR